MRKFLSLLVLLVAFTSCEEDIKFNTPAFQGFKNNELWKSTQYTATVGVDNSLTLEATNGFEIVVLRTANTAPGIYKLGFGETNKATYTLSIDEDGIEDSYLTGTNIGGGQIEISAADTDLAAGYISGTFYFRAVNDMGDEVFFDNGVFYKMPILAVAP